MTRNVWKTVGLFAAIVSAPMSSSAKGFAEGISESWSCEGNCGTSEANGVVTLAPGGGERFGWVTTAGSGFREAFLPGIGGTNGSRLRSAPFSARAGEDLEFSFNYVTSDGAGFADYGWARLLDASLEPVALLFTARTRSSGNVVPGFGMPDIEAAITPETVNIIGPGPSWSVLGGDSGRCYASGCGYTGWVKSTYTIPDAGEYVLEFGVVNWADTQFQSGLAFDGLLIGGKPIDAEPDYRDVRVLATLSGQGIDVVPMSFVTPPVRVETGPETTNVEWFFETFSLEDAKTLDFSVHVVNPQPGEIRPVVEQVVLQYRDLAGREHQRLLGPRNVEVFTSALAVEVATDRPSYVAGESLQIHSTIGNLGEVGLQSRVELEIQDTGGQTVVLRKLPGEHPVAPGASQTLPVEDFDSAGLYAGDYRVLARAIELDTGLSSTASAAFSVTVPANTGLSATVLADRAVYQPLDEVLLTGRVFNDAPNWQAEGHTRQLVVHSPGGELFWSNESPLSNLVAGAQVEISGAFALGSAPAGTYRVLHIVRDAEGFVVTMAETHFTVASTAETGVGLTGTITAHPSPVLRSDWLGLSAGVANRGNAGLAGVPIQLALVDPAHETELARWEWTPDLDQNAGLDLHADWIADVPGGTVLVAILTANIGAETRVLDSMTLRVEERFVSNLGFQGYGRVLVLLDGPRGDECTGVTGFDVIFNPGGVLLSGDHLDVELRTAEGALLDSETVHLGDPISTDENVGHPVNLVVGEMDHAGSLLSLSSTDGDPIPEGPYQILATVSHGGGIESFESPILSAACRDLDASIDVDVESDDVFRVIGAHRLVGGPAHARRDFLETLLSGRGWSYTIVSNRDAFASELRRGGYASYLLLAEQVKLDNQVARELRESVFTGRGIVMAGAHDHRNHHLLEAFGVNLVGVHADASAITPLDLSPIPIPDASFSQAERPLRLRLETAAPVAEYRLGSGGRTTDTAAVAIHEFGFGSSVIVGFDLLNQAYLGGDASGFSRLLLSTLEYVQPSEVPHRAGMTIPVNWQVLNRGGLASLSLFLEVGGGRIVDPGVAQQEGPLALSRDLELAAGETDEFAFWWQLPSETEAASITAWLDLREGVSTREYGEVIQSFGLEPIVDFAWVKSRIHEAAEAGTVSWRSLSDIERAETLYAREDLIRAVFHLLRAAEGLGDIAEPDVMELRAAVGWLIHHLSMEL